MILEHDYSLVHLWFYRYLRYSHNGTVYNANTVYSLGSLEGYIKDMESILVDLPEPE